MTDEEIFEILSECETRPVSLWADCTLSAQAVVRFAREIIAKAQECKPLEFKLENGVYTLMTVFGQYHVANASPGELKWHVQFCGSNPFDHWFATKMDTEAEAIAYAQADHDRRVLSRLKNG